LKVYIIKKFKIYKGIVKVIKKLETHKKCYKIMKLNKTIEKKIKTKKGLTIVEVFISFSISIILLLSILIVVY